MYTNLYQQWMVQVYNFSADNAIENMEILFKAFVLWLMTEWQLTFTTWLLHMLGLFSKENFENILKAGHFRIQMQKKVGTDKVRVTLSALWECNFFSQPSV